MTVNNSTDPDNQERGEETPEESSPENKQEETNPSSGGEKDKKPDAQPKPVPFHEDPKVQEYIERQVEQRGEKLRAAITAEVEAKLKGFQPAAPKDERVVIPEWFGGDEKQWRAYQADQARIIADAEKRAEDKAFDRLNSTRTAEDRAVQEANKHFEDSIGKIESENNVRVDRNELLKYVLENQIIDHTTKRWDYAKGYRWMTAEKTAAGTAKGGNRQARKDLAGASTDNSSKGEPESKTVTSAEDFKDPSKRPW